MRFKISFNRSGKQRLLPMDYQYYICAWIYKVLRTADKDFANFLHQQGYGVDQNKLYKLFCFSRLNFGKPKLWSERKLFEISPIQISLQVAFDVNDAANHFIKGLFLEQEFFLGNKFNGIDLKVTGIEALPEPEFNPTMHYSLITPWVISYKNDNSTNPKYLTPDDDLFNTLSVKHIVEKFNNNRDKKITENDLLFIPNQQYKRSGFVIKPDTPQQTRIVGNLFDFTLSAPVEIHKLIWNAGVSEKSSSGFGWVELTKNKTVHATI